MILTADDLETIRTAAYAAGDLRLAMTRTQRIAHRRLVASQETLFVVDCSRRWGKTIFDSIEMTDCALKVPRGILRWSVPTVQHGRDFVLPAMDYVSSLLPEHLRPRYYSQHNKWVWPSTGAVCHLGSCESLGDVQAQIGTECHRACIDEASKIRSDLLKVLIHSVLLPQFLTTRAKVRGYVIVTSTPADELGHYYTELVEAAQHGGAFVGYTIDDCDHIPRVDRDATTADMLGLVSGEIRDSFVAGFRACESTTDRIEYIRTHGGPLASFVLRELYRVHTVDETRLVVPDFVTREARIVREMERPEFKQWYTVADLGFHDLSIALLAYHDFARNKIVVWDEHVTHRESGVMWGRGVVEMEAKWDNARHTSHRYADGTAQLLADIADTSYGPGLAFALPIKNDAQAALNAMRMRIWNEQIEIHPRCKTLITHLKGAMWNTNRTDYKRAEGFGHWDGIPALTYLCRMVNVQKNPAPSILPTVADQTHYIPQAAHDAAQRARKSMGFF